MKKLLILSLSILSLFGTGFDYLNQENQGELNIQKEINSLSSKNLKLNWIEPIIASYSYTKNNQANIWKKTKYFRVSLNQPIFKSGGIYFAIKYATANKKFKILATTLQQNTLIIRLYDLTLNLKKLDIQIKQIKLNIKNADLEIKIKKDRFLSGDDDISFLNKAMLNKNNLLLKLNNLKTKHKELENNFKNISNYSYKTIFLPKLTLISKKEFLIKNLELKKEIQNLHQKNQLKNMTISNYLATISLVADYNYIKTKLEHSPWKKNRYKNYGVTISIPFSLNETRDIEIKKLEVLKEKLSLKQKQRDLKSEYINIYQTEQNLQNKLKILKQNIKLYNSLIKIVKGEVDAGDKTREDLQTIKNSKKSLLYDLTQTKYDIQINLLKLFEKMEMHEI